MLNAFQNYLERLMDAGLIQGLAYDIAAHQPPAVVWRLLLAAGTKHPTTVGHAIRSLAWDHSIVTESDTTSLAGGFLQAIYPTLVEAERGRVEQAIMEIPARVPENVPVASRFRDRLIGCLDPTLLVTPAAIAHRVALETSGGPPPNLPDPKIEVSHREFSQDDFHRERGVPLADPNTNES